MAETLNTRVTRLEKAMAQMARSQTKFQTQVGNALAHLAEAQAHGETLAREREKRIDQRIEKLVIAMGEFIRRQNGKP